MGQQRDEIQCGNETFYPFKLPSLIGTNDVDYLWLICTILVLVGSLSVLLWRCTRRSDQRNSVPSILIINLAVADLLLGVQMLLYLLFTAWPCSVFSNRAVVDALCVPSACLQMISGTMSSVVTATIAFYFLVSFACSQYSSRMCIISIVVFEWIGVSIGGYCYVQYVVQDVPTDENAFDSSKCLPMTATPAGFAILCLLFIAVVVYIVLLVMIKRQGSRSGAPVTGLQIRLIVIAFGSFIFWCVYGTVIAVFLEDDFFNYEFLYYDLICVASVAICNPLVFTLLSRPFFKSVVSVWACVCYKCGRPRQISEIYSSEEGQDPLLTRVASQTNYSSSSIAN